MAQDYGVTWSIAACISSGFVPSIQSVNVGAYIRGLIVSNTSSKTTVWVNVGGVGSQKFFGVAPGYTVSMPVPAQEAISFTFTTSSGLPNGSLNVLALDRPIAANGFAGAFI